MENEIKSMSDTTGVFAQMGRAANYLEKIGETELMKGVHLGMTELSKIHGEAEILRDKIGGVFTSTLTISRFDFQQALAFMEADIRVWESINSDTARARVQVLRPHYRAMLELYSGVVNGTAPATQSLIDNS